MPKKRPSVAAASPTAQFGQLLVPPPDEIGAQEAVGVRAPVDRRVDPPAARPVDALDPITQQLGARFWRMNAVFEWCRQPNTYKHRFTRFYFEQSVLVDIFGSRGAEIDKEIAQKVAAIVAENKRRKKLKKPPLGYLPIIRGATVPFDYFERAREGEILPLCRRTDLTAALV